jgi:hypothetical protein
MVRRRHVALRRHVRVDVLRGGATLVLREIDGGLALERRREVAHARVEAEKIRRAPALGEAVAERCLVVEPEPDAGLKERLRRKLARVDAYGTTREVCWKIGRRRLHDRERIDDERREHVERNGRAIRLGAR